MQRFLQNTRFPRRVLRALAACALAAAATGVAGAQSLRPSRASLDRQNAEARRLDYTFLSNRQEVHRFVELGYLVPVRGNEDYELKEVSFPYARPAVRTFIERLSAPYRAACGEKLVVTSLTRPRRLQPRNASRRSVHPTGMALDLRRSWSRRCRGWLEHTLLTLEGHRVLEATLERSPPHYHVALYPTRYEEHVDSLLHAPVDRTYMVMYGDTLWKIAQRHKTTVQYVKQTNGLRSNRIYPGQILNVPSGE